MSELKDINISSSIKCECTKGQCFAFVDDDEHCINRLDGDVRILYCESCKSGSWHHNGKCLRSNHE